MTDREKLIELFVESAAMDYKDSAEYFLANGVTIQKWIPVSERLPEPNVPVLAYVRSKKIVCVSYDDVMEDWDIVGTRCSCFTKRYVTHWMPLPEPPKEEKNNG